MLFVIGAAIMGAGMALGWWGATRAFRIGADLKYRASFGLPGQEDEDGPQTPSPQEVAGPLLVPWNSDPEE